MIGLKEAAQQAKAKQVAWVKAQRLKGVSYKQIAEKLGVSRQRVHQIEKGN